MKLYTLACLGALSTMFAACHINVDDCGDDDWDDDDDQPCEKHVHADTTSTTGASVSSSGGAGATTGSGGSGSGGSGSGGSGSGGSGSGGSGSGGSGSDAAGGSTGSSGSASATSDGSAGDAGAPAVCSSCSDQPETRACLWGSASLDSCCGVEVLVEAAAEGCTDYGLQLASFELEDACNGGHHRVSYQCCRDSDSCTERSVTLDACVGEAVLASLADDKCLDTGEQAVDLNLTDACGDGTFQSVDFACCGG